MDTIKTLSSKYRMYDTQRFGFDKRISNQTHTRKTLIETIH